MFKKYITLIGLLTVVSAAHAATVGPFVDASIGSSMINTPVAFAFNLTAGNALMKRQIGGFGWRVAGGYNFTKYFGVEGAYLRPADSKYTASGDLANASLTYSDKIGELLFDGYWTTTRRSDIYGKVGAAYINQQVGYQNDNAYILPINTEKFSPDITGGHYSKIAPAFELGMSYSFIPSAMINVGYTYIYSDADFKNQKDAVAGASYLSVGLRYTFPVAKHA
ncbi:MAG: hypothetical protein CMF39_00805 [Legionellaceae bacterium]|nr:hypothetical protein [Legionellaceae bacterium]|tara:strand:- start:46 stop:714 length:669 start_codon:yes stop_codon:yes gene_type:complete